MKSVEPCEAARPSARENGAAYRIMASIGRFFSDMKQRAAMRAEFMEYDRNGGLDIVLHDIGLTRPELVTMIGGYPVSGRMLPAMAARVGVDLDAVGIGSRQQLSRGCALCHSRRACRHWLDNAAAEGGAYRKFCPNAEIFDAILLLRAQRKAAAQ